MEAELTYLQNGIKIFDLRHYKEDAEMGNPYNTLFSLSVVSGAFSGACQWEDDIRNLEDFCTKMKELYDFKITEITLDDLEYGSKIAFSMEKNGHLSISGTIYGSRLENTLTFKFSADQTALPPFIRQLETLIETSK